MSAVVGLALAGHVSRYVLSDQPYVAKFVAQNLEENRQHGRTSPPGSRGSSSKAPQATNGRRGNNKPAGGHRQSHNIADHHHRPPPAADSLSLFFAPLDWELDEVTASLTGSADVRDFDAVLACDCIYNEALIEPFVRTCVDVCKLRSENADATDAASRTPCVCIVAQQLRDSDVFEAWARRFCQSFQAYRVPDDQLPDGLRTAAGFVVHVGLLRN